MGVPIPTESEHDFLSSQRGETAPPCPPLAMLVLIGVPLRLVRVSCVPTCIQH